MHRGYSALVFAALFLLQTAAVLAEGVIPAYCESTDDGLEVTQSFSPNLEYGDVITHANGVEIKPKTAVAVMKRLTKTTNTLTLTIKRDGRTLERQVTLISENEFVAKQQAIELDRDQKKKEKALEKWLANNKLTDSSGKVWSIEQIAEHNDPIEVDVIRAVRKNRDAEQDAKYERDLDFGIYTNKLSLGGVIGRGWDIVKIFEDVAQAPEGRPYKAVLHREGRHEVTIKTFDDIPGLLSDVDFERVETLFDYTDAENYLIWCRDGKVIRAGQLWLKMVRGAGK